MGTTPRLRRDLLASLMDLISGSGERDTPVVVVRNYF
jgi:F420-0:gamma-glutamyl ligase